MSRETNEGKLRGFSYCEEKFVRKCSHKIILFMYIFFHFAYKGKAQAVIQEFYMPTIKLKK